MLVQYVSTVCDHITSHCCSGKLKGPPPTTGKVFSLVQHSLSKSKNGVILFWKLLSYFTPSTSCQICQILISTLPWKQSKAKWTCELRFLVIRDLHSIWANFTIRWNRRYLIHKHRSYIIFAYINMISDYLSILSCNQLGWGLSTSLHPSAPKGSKSTYWLL